MVHSRRVTVARARPSPHR